jgi:hypothetical protein
MHQELSSFLIVVSAIVALLVLVPGIESIVKLVHRRAQRSDEEISSRRRPANGLSGKIA